MRCSVDSERRPRYTRLALYAGLLAVSSLAPRPALAQRVFHDRLLDAEPRPTDPGVTLPFDPGMHRLVDLQQASTARWRPDAPASDLFNGAASPDGEFFRLQLVFSGLVNPPGSADPLDFEPFRYGDHPVFGFIEIDMDEDVDTGGELNAPEYRYLGNAVRFGGNVLREEYRERVATDASAFDEDFESPPQVERHGEEFHLALLGTQFSSSGIELIDGDGDLLFEHGETWNIEGFFFHRAHAYELFSFVEGGRNPGEYSPVSHLRFQHDPVDDVTHVTLVFPLTNVGAGLMHDEPPEPTNQDPTDHASILEALEDLQLSAFFLPILPTGLPEEAILINWAERDPKDHLDPTNWNLTAIVGTSYTAAHPETVFYVWTDIFPDVVAGDVDGSGAVDGPDRQLIARHIAQHDHLDGLVDGAVTILGFADDFSLFDVNYDGVVDGLDLTPVEADGDGDEDGDVDLHDFGMLQACFAREDPGSSACRAFDLVPDSNIDLDDVAEFNQRIGGPMSD